MIKDVQGIVVSVGDKVAFAGGGRGASEFYVGLVSKVTAKGVTIQTEHEIETWSGRGREIISSGCFYDKTYQRKEGMFAILESNNG